MENIRSFHLLNKMYPADVNIYLHLQLYSVKGYEPIAVIG